MFISFTHGKEGEAACPCLLPDKGLSVSQTTKQQTDRLDNTESSSPPFFNQKHHSRKVSLFIHTLQHMELPREG